MNLKDTARVLDEISREQLPSDLNLMPGIAAKIQQGKLTMNPARKLHFIAPIILALVLLIALLSLPGVASALEGLIGYIPGVGTVDQSVPLRVLANPVTSTRDGYTITIESAVLDSTRTVLNYRISGLFPSWDDPARRPQMCSDAPALRLPDGTMLEYPSRTGSYGGGMDSAWQDVYPAVPANVNNAVLVMPCLAELPAGEGPKNWEIQLAFAPAPPEMTVFPVIQSAIAASQSATAAPQSATAASQSATAVPPTNPAASTPVEPPIGEVTATPAAAEAAPSPDGWQFTLEGMAVLDEGFYLETILRWEEDPRFYQIEILPDAVHLYDANNQEVSVWLADQITTIALAEQGSLALNLQTAPFQNPGPARLVIDAVGVHTFPFATFTLDVGSDPQPGQVWQVNKTLEIEGHQLRVVSAEYIQAGANEPAMLLLNLESDSIYSAIATDSDHETLGSAGSPGSELVPFRAGWYYANGFPTGTLNITISSIVVRKPVQWSLTWVPPIVESTPTSAVPLAPGICEDVEPALTTVDKLPDGLGGHVAFTEGEQYNLFVANLDGSERIPLGPGLFPQLSPDGQRVVYRGMEGGLFVRDVDGGEPALLTGPIQENVFDAWPKWSPDGQRIAFERVIDHKPAMYVMDADGSNVTELIPGKRGEGVPGWSLVYQEVTPDGEQLSILVLDISSGQMRQVALLPLEGMQFSLSPDATRMIIISDRGVFLLPLDGSEPVLLRSAANLFTTPIWSADGQWVLMAYLNKENNSLPGQVLLQPDTCQMLRLESPLGNIVTSWVSSAVPLP